MYTSKSIKVKEQLVKSKLKEYGYEKEKIDKLDFSEDRDEEMDNAKENLRKILKNNKLDLNNYENIKKIKLKLVMKGFNYDIINLAFEEVMNDEIN